MVFYHSRLKQIGMIAHFTELHDQIHQVFDLCLRAGQHEQVLCTDLHLDAVVKDTLPMAQLALDSLFYLGCDLLLDVFFETTQHEWLQDHMQAL